MMGVVHSQRELSTFMCGVIENKDSGYRRTGVYFGNMKMAKEIFSLADLIWAKYWLAMGFGLIGLVFYLSLTTISMPGGIDHIDKFYHFTTYAVLMGWFAQVFPHFWARICLAVAFTSMGVGIEFLQGLHPMRYFDTMDMLANLSGVIVAFGLTFTRLGLVFKWIESLFIKRCSVVND